MGPGEKGHGPMDKNTEPMLDVVYGKTGETK
jgi:hypothetical protein